MPAGTAPGERYLLGKLVPRRPAGGEPAGDAEQAAEDDDVEDRPELVEGPGLDLELNDSADAPAAAAVRGRAMASSSLGLVFALPPDVEQVTVEASWGRYEREPSDTQMTDTGRPRTVWRRVPAGGACNVPVAIEGLGTAIPDGTQEQVELRWRVRLRLGRRMVEVFLVNLQQVRAELLDRDRLFQVALTVTGGAGEPAVFLGHNDPELPEVHHESDDELRLLALQHRTQRLFATGRLCAVDAEVRDGEARAWRLQTTCFPAAEVNMVVAGDPADTPGLVLDMALLGSSELSGDHLVRALRPMVDGYRQWIDGQAARIDVDAEVGRFSEVARPAVERARRVADRLERAIELLHDARVGTRGIPLCQSGHGPPAGPKRVSPSPGGGAGCRCDGTAGGARYAQDA